MGFSGLASGSRYERIRGCAAEHFLIISDGYECVGRLYAYKPEARIRQLLEKKGLMERDNWDRFVEKTSNEVDRHVEVRLSQ